MSAAFLELPLPEAGSFDNLRVRGEYMHRASFDCAAEYGKDRARFTY